MSCEDVAGSRRTQPPVDYLWCLVSSFPGLSVNSDNLSFSYVILFLLFTYVSYMHETWSWHAYRFALGFLWKTGVTAYFNAWGLLYECVFDALLFSSSYRPVGKPVSHHVIAWPTFSSLCFFGSSYRPSCPPRCSDTTLWVHLRCPLNFFTVVSIYWKPTSFRSSLDLSSFGKTINRSAAKLICSFLTDVHAIRPVDSSTTSSWPF
jgi:hypothetical protein